MTEDLLVGRVVLALKLSLNVSRSVFVSISTCVFWKTNRERRLLDLFSKQVFLVEEENDGGVDEVPVVADGAEEHEGLVHAVGYVIFADHLVISAQGNAENYSGQIVIKDPLPFWPQPTHITQPDIEIFKGEMGF